jgi:hypothetical protein
VAVVGGGVVGGRHGGGGGRGGRYGGGGLNRQTHAQAENIAARKGKATVSATRTLS